MLAAETRAIAGDVMRLVAGVQLLNNFSPGF
jgi:hypothetical protein